MRSLVELAVRRRVSVVMTALAVIAFGIVGFKRLSLELLPDISYPSLTIQTDFPDTAPQEVENLVTRPIEEAVGVLKGLQNIRSVSRAGVSEITLEFSWSSDMDMLSMEVRDKLDRLILPEEAENPVILRFDPSLEPFIRLALSADEDLMTIRNLAERKIKPDMETIKGVASANIRGGLEEEIRIEVDQDKLAALGITLDRVRQVVEVSNINIPGGLLRSPESQYLVRTINEFSSIEEIGDLIIKQNGPSIVKLRDVASISHGSRDREEITRVNGKECVEIALFKEGDANIVKTAEAVYGRINAWRAKLPPGYSMTTLFDQSHFIKQAINEVRNAAVIGGFLAVLVIFLFLRHIKSTLIIATSIPISVIATFVFMYRWDISLNIMSLGGLTLGIGMLVDSSIVVLEAIHRKKMEKLPIDAASVEGTMEVGPAVAASTLTTVAVFLPIVFVEGIAGKLFRDQAITVTISLLASLLVAMTMIPMLSAMGNPGQGEGTARGTRTKSTIMTMGRLSHLYDRLLKGSLSHKWATLLTAFSLLALSMAATRWIGTQLVPDLNEGEFYFEVKTPEGTSLSGTDAVMRRMEEEVSRQPLIEKYYSTVGSRFVAGGMSLNTKAENLGQLNIVMKNRRDASSELHMAEILRSSFEDIPDLEVKLGKPSYFSLKTPVEVDVFGDNLEELRDYSIDLARLLSNLPGLADVRSSLEEGTPEVQVVFDRSRLASLGLDLGVMSETLKNRVLGVVPTHYKEEDKQIDIRIRNQESDRASIADISNLVLPGPGGKGLRLLSVADIRLDRGPSEIHRIQQQRAAVITANLKGRSLGSAVEAVEKLIRDNPPPKNLSVEMGGQNREMKRSFASLRFALLLAVFLVYLVMAATFESFIHPFIVLFTIPLAVIGVAAGLLVTRTNISVIVLIGVIMLVGIVVNNAIVLIDAINRFRREGLSKIDAVIRAGHLRLRPILMTTLTTVLALIPMALEWGEGSELRTPLAVTVTFGLFFSTLLTLVVIPTAYMLVPSRVPATNEEDTSPGQDK